MQWHFQNHHHHQQQQQHDAKLRNWSEVFTVDTRDHVLLCSRPKVKDCTKMMSTIWVHNFQILDDNKSGLSRSKSKHVFGQNDVVCM